MMTFPKHKQKWIFIFHRGVKLAWLIVPQHQQTYIYRPSQEVKTVVFSEILTGEDVLEGFEVKIDNLLSEE